jgi:hypothetical protein
LQNKGIPRSQKYFRNRRRVSKRNTAWNCKQLAFVGADVLGVCATRFNRHHAIAGLPHLHAFTDSTHNT